MTESTQFWQYAEDAMFSASLSKSEMEKRGLMDLARIWSKAAMESEIVFAAKGSATTPSRPIA